MSKTSDKRFKKALVWFRRDLRTLDNQALSLACSECEQVIPLFILDPAELSRSDMSPSRLCFLLNSLEDLDSRLRRLGGRLVVLEGHAPQTALEAAVRWRVDCVYHQREIEPAGAKRDSAVAKALGEAGIARREMPGLTILEPEELRTAAGSIYTVFTPFKRAWLALPFEHPANYPKRVLVPDDARGLDIPAGLKSLRPVSSQAVPAGGESAALDLLRSFIAGPCEGYAEKRDYPSENGTSRLSPHLHFGTVSARMVRHTLQDTQSGLSPSGRRSIDVFISELCWRDFYLYILHHFPYVEKSAFKKDLAGIEWEDDDLLFDRWSEGMTGYPIVDAAMRQLKAEAWMHNRCRMIVASFLCKDLLTDWRRGELHFMQNLVDGDLASNNGGWQWSAGTGTDAQPYFRIFNPTSQGLKFDPEGAYVRRWVPELARVPSFAIHCPWTLSPAEKEYLGCKAYPERVVDHSIQRARALSLYKPTGKEAAA